MAERVGFEPTVPVRGQRFSRPPDSAALAPLRKSLPIAITDYTGRHSRYRGNGFRGRTIEPLSHLSGYHSQSRSLTTQADTSDTEATVFEAEQLNPSRTSPLITPNRNECLRRHS